jgi:hypothetical protein
MILRRFVENLKQQHWTSVCIELAIVVLGVFIGLQVDNWNDGRKAAGREQAYLRGIAADLDESIASLEDSIKLQKERMALDEFLIQAAADPQLVRAQPGKFVYAVTRGGYSFDPTIRGYTFEEIQSTGDIGILHDQKLVLDLMKFYAGVQGQSQWTFLKATNQSEYIKRSAGILTAGQLMAAPASTHVIPDVPVDDAMAAYQRMLAHPDFIQWLPTTLFYRSASLEAFETFLASATALRARVLAEPGVAKGKD